MTTRKPFLAGNWKMHKSRDEAVALATALRDLVGTETEREVAVFPAFPAIEGVRQALEGSPIRVGAQTCHHEPEGAFTGEVSAEMLRDAGIGLVLVGHSERREHFGETDEVVAKKLRAALRAGIDAILCVGESLEERQADRTETVVERQLTAALEGLSAERFASVTVAYEPVWAIGTGRTATPEQAQEVHGFLRGVLADRVGGEAAAAARIQYGGSVKPGNIAGLMAEPDIDGALVGGASLDAESFAGIVGFGRG